ncbi:MAG TPA: polyphosphate kinase 1 [Planctomycetes bacterium]|nr:polyphosphate kinase 1 [Planctomycetota bacterium]
MDEGGRGAGELEPSLDEPSFFLNRELSQLEFVHRVLALAKDPGVPLLERLRYLCITSAVLDEFFEIRVAGLKQKELHHSVHTGPDNLSPSQTLERIHQKAHHLVDSQYHCLNQDILPALADEGVRFLRRKEWNKAQKEWVDQLFHDEILPLLSPLGLDPAHPFPRVQNKSLNFIVPLEGRDAFGRDHGIAVVQAPRALPRIIPLPSEVAGGPYEFVFLSSIIHAHVADLFRGMNVKGCYQFRLTRNSDLFVDEEEVDDLLHALEGELRSRNFGDAVRLEVADNCPEEITTYLQHQFGLEKEDVYKVEGPVNLHRLMSVPDRVARPDLKFRAFTPEIPAELHGPHDIFELLRSKDLLFHHPFQSFAPVVEFLKRAAEDPKVLAIKMTLYRTGSDSALIDALEKAALAGKEVTVVIELMARFDERANIDLATRLQDAGAYVAYGVVGYKTHAKMTLVLRKDPDGLRNYVHLGTGNYHQRTARLYTDFGLMSSDPALCEDVRKIFLLLTGLGTPQKMDRVVPAPFDLQKGLLGWIQTEIQNKKAGRPSGIQAKMNSLTDPKIIKALYKASRAGVPVDLIVRGICRLKPGIPGISENIRVRSILGRFLEHTRAFVFENGGDPRVFLSSADWMERNLYRRVETCFPVLDPGLKKRVQEEAIEAYLKDNLWAWELGPDGHYERRNPAEGEEPFSAQLSLLQRFGTEKS